MKEKKYIDFSTEDFVLDDIFRKWVLNPDQDDDLFWESILEKYPDKRDEMMEAELIIRSLQPVRPDISEKRLHNIFKKIESRRKTVSVKYWSSIAAGIAILISAGTLIWNLALKNNLSPFDVNCIKSEKGRIILSDGSIKEFEAEKTVIKQMISGNLTVDNDTVKITEPGNKKDREAINQIIIPYGKRSEITLSDGTHIWLNSGSKLSYPSLFNPGSREVYLSGEAFFEVSTDKTRPFYVICRDFRVKVLGTKFNISAYNEDSITRTVLLEGKVTASRNKLFAKEVDLMPGEEILFDKTGGDMVKKKVDIRLYTSWINGYLLFENESTDEVFKKLERYYNQEIKFERPHSNSSFSGKLDLADDLNTVLENISFTSSLTISKQDSIYIVK